jgi:hypothetical protein
MLYPRDAPRILLLALVELEATPASSEGWASSIKASSINFAEYHCRVVDLSRSAARSLCCGDGLELKLSMVCWRRKKSGMNLHGDGNRRNGHSVTYGRYMYGAKTDRRTEKGDKGRVVVSGLMMDRESGLT